MLRFIFGPGDLGRTRVAAGPLPLWETVMSLHRIQTSADRWRYGDWFAATRAGLTAEGLRRLVREVLVPLAPRASYFPDFLTPTGNHERLDSGLSAILATPDSQVRAELRKLVGDGPAPTWLRELPGRRERTELTDALRTYHDVAVRPWESRAWAATDADRAMRARIVLAEGVDGLLRSFHPHVRWKPPVLEIEQHPGDREVRLNGQGLLLVPSYFCRGVPVALADPGLEQLLVYPVELPLPSPPSQKALGNLLGHTRAAVLLACVPGSTTTELSRQVGIAPATASHHVHALREAGLVVSTRLGNAVQHTTTSLGNALLRGG